MAIDASTPIVNIGIAKKRLALCRLLLTYGILYRTSVGVTVNEFLLCKLPVDAAYIQNRIQTIFLDGHPIDLPDQRRIQQSCTLSLSAAMPGLFGAAFRKNGRFGPLRRQTAPPNGSVQSVAEKSVVTVTVKCFNQVAASIGDAVLAQGAKMTAENFHRFWRRHLSVLQRDCRWVYLNKTGISPQALTDTMAEHTDEVEVKISAVD